MDSYRTEVRLARLCFQMLKTSRRSPRFAGGKDVKAVMPDSIGHPNKKRTMEQKNKGGRPRSSRVQKKSRAVTVRYSALQYDIVRHRARTAGYRTLTEYVREASVNAEVVQNFIQEHNAAFRDLSALCNNLNQLTRLAHAQGLQSTEGALSDLLPQVLNLITHLHKEMKRQKVL